MQQDSRNLLIAMGLSLLVILGWSHFFGAPKVEQARRMQQQLSQMEGAGAAHPGVAEPGQAPGQGPVTQFMTRAEALAQSKRIPLETPSLFGSIALKGARLDDLSLRHYRETTNPKSPNIILLSPSGAPDAYFVDFNYVAQNGGNLKLPNSDTIWAADGDKLTPATPVTLTFDNGSGLIFKRKVSVDDHYLFTVTDTVENRGKDTVAFFPDSSVTRQGTPKTSGYSVLHEGFVGVIGADARSTEITYHGIAKETNEAKVLPVDSYAEGGWLGFTDKYWATAVIPDPTESYKGWFREFPGALPQYQADAFGKARTLAPGANMVLTTRLFAGAKESSILEYYEKDVGIKKLDLLIDWGYFFFITRPMFWLLETIYKLVGNFGVAILAVTLVVKLLFFPLANRSYLSMAKMKEAQPKIKALQELYPDDKMKQQQEMMELYKREKINPVSGCLPMILQIPVFFSLYKVLFVAIEMRQAPFFGWIKDLSAPDPTNIFNLFGLLPFEPTQLPVFGHFLHLGVWPLVMGVSMWVQMKMNPEPTDPVQKTMFAWMPVIFTFMLGSFPAGLVIYWTWNNLLSVSQQMLIMKKAGVKVELFDNLRKTFSRKAA
ncbi:membrane protein insertase YidC [Rhodoblastus acidophilus]|uniref:Membrane protein insertase YidC n=1 Tax=Candidatus Rhodoblastus alkanivorans TaxID=2954117 RepID=A0ABS9ZB99_9HYPH|nr:membrane protein insertase YidC [Candidatus Rhodoblastus alkanivorans]MCI4677747.1 membrane protein insertase YidC [Candidatus Rhodoblastus alkanivorans]MCI4684755.1 membrane protein insertase YidC [Candidatus Rhodoblastus alkanivorans]MDI4642078.1 membrane protein insertase YidC [Rhodoblastus acidophilus]